MFNSIIFYLVTTLVIFLVSTTLIWSISGLLLSNANLTLRAHRKILIQITQITSICYGMVLCKSMNDSQYFLQSTFLLLGAILLFCSSFLKINLVTRKKTYIISLIWGGFCIVWTFLFPLKSEYLFIFF
jgi:hypothetical protein